MSKPFDFIDDVGSRKTDLSRNGDTGISGYSPWLTNSHFAKFSDTIAHANEVNAMHALDPQMQHDYYLYALRPRRRFAKKSGRDSDQAEITRCLSAWYGINKRRATEVAALLGATVVAEIVTRVNSIECEGQNVGS